MRWGKERTSHSPKDQKNFRKATDKKKENNLGINLQRVGRKDREVLGRQKRAKRAKARATRIGRAKVRTSKRQQRGNGSRVEEKPLHWRIPEGFKVIAESVASMVTSKAIVGAKIVPWKS